MPRWLNLVPRVPSRSDGLELTRRCCGPGSGTLSASRASEYNEAIFCALESRWAKRRDGSVCRQVSPLDGRLKMLHGTAGPTFCAFDAIRVRGFTIFKDIKPSPLELPIVETPTRPDIAPRVLRMNGRGGSRYLKGSRPRLQARLK